MSALRRNNIQARGAGARAMVFAHGFGCDQNMWRHVAPAFEGEFRTVLFDNVGAGASDLTAYDPAKYATLEGYADDLIEIIRELGLTDAILVGHSVSAMVGVIASLKAPELFSALILVGPSPRYIDDEGYVGGFSASQIDELLEFLGEQPDGLVAGHGAGDHGQRRQA
jgi:sigma-B regulation protein RsbQ